MSSLNYFRRNRASGFSVVVCLHNPTTALRCFLTAGMPAQFKSPFSKPVLTVFMKRMYSPARVAQRLDRSSSHFRSVELLTLLSLFCMLSACTPTNRLAVEPLFPEPRPERPTAVERAMPDVEYRLRSEVVAWSGAPHALGGTTVDGIDCSAFVQKVYESALNVQLPRTTREQVHAGKPVQRRDLRPGDLVFFRPPTKTRHVGIYLNEGEFAHVSSSQGVTVSDINHEYWDQSYWTSRRVLPESEPPEVRGRSLVIESRPLPSQSRSNDIEEPTRERIGW